MPPVLALCLTPISSNFPCLEHLFIVPKVFEPFEVRPISLLNSEDKLLERLVFKYLFNHLRDNNLLSSLQSGFLPGGGWSGGAMVLGKLPVPGRPTVWMIVGQGPIALAVGAGGGCLDVFTLLYPFSPLSPSLWETVRYRLKYCLKGPLNPKQPTNQSFREIQPSTS